MLFNGEDLLITDLTGISWKKVLHGYDIKGIGESGVQGEYYTNLTSNICELSFYSLKL